MSTLTQPAQFTTRARVWRSALFVTTAIVLALSVAECLNLFSRHMVGAESYAVLVAALAVGAGIFNLGLVLSQRRRIIATAAVLVLWAVVGLGGLAGTYYHAVGVDPQYSSDTRPRPVASPLIFTALAVVGGGALFVAQRNAARNPES